MHKFVKGEQYLIPIDSFCALDYKFKKIFFLKEILPSVHKECLDNLTDAYDVSLENGDFPINFYERGRKKIFEDHKLPSHIPVEIIKKENFTDFNSYYRCKELYSGHIFIVPGNLLTFKLYPLEEIIRCNEEKYVDEKNIENLLYLYYVKLHTIPKNQIDKVKIKKRKK